MGEMNTYRLVFTQTVTVSAYVDAESESAARQCFIDGDYDDTSIDEFLDDTDELIRVVDLGPAD